MSISQSLLFSLNVDTSLMSNIQKLFTERIEVFTSVDFSKVSVLTGIIKISLKVHFFVGFNCSYYYHISTFTKENLDEMWI